MIDYKINRSHTRKHTYITIQKDTTVLVKTSLFTSKKRIEAFIQEKKEWILTKQKQIASEQEHHKQHYYLFGNIHERGTLTQSQIDTLYREKAKELIPPLVTQYSALMTLYPSRISFRKNKSRWGSCSAKNALSFNINLIQTPHSFIEYVIVHELAHIAHKNHSPAFWKLVEKYLPDYKTRKNTVKEQYFLL